MSLSRVLGQDLGLFIVGGIAWLGSRIKAHSSLMFKKIDLSEGGQIYFFSI